jgi:predicted RNA-binding Zn-ribbon protein involved in translation (DUF1610 family)
MATSPTPPKRTAAYVELEHPLGIATLFCPVCGQEIIGKDEGPRDSDQLCDHVLLVHDWAGEFHTRDDEIQALVDDALDEGEAKDAAAIDLLRAKFGQNVVFFESSQPTTGTQKASAITVAIDMEPAGQGTER